MVWTVVSPMSAVAPSLAKHDVMTPSRSHTAHGREMRIILVALILVHIGLLAWGAHCHSPTWDEIGHLPAGIGIWKLGRFHLYRVNPPLVRAIASLPVLCTEPKLEWDASRAKKDGWEAIRIGELLVENNGVRSFWMFTLARWACIPFSLLGAYVCYRWAADLYGELAGAWSLVLWCFSPNILAHAQLITPDLGATALGVTAGYLFWRWLKRPVWPLALASGAALGLAELAKATWVILYGLWPVLWITWMILRRHQNNRPGAVAQCWQLGGILLLGLYVLNLGYAFDGSFRKLRDFDFSSELLGGSDGRVQASTTSTKGNRFAETWLGAIPVPVPADYLLGIDDQRLEFESKHWSFLHGEWRFGGWWYYYLYALAIKVPLGTWALIILAAAVGPFLPDAAKSRRDQMILLAPLVVVLVFVSSQTGFSHHLRYVLLSFPFAFIWAGRVARAVTFIGWRFGGLAAAALVWSVTSSLWIYPHSLSYFNELVGGPRGGHAYLDNSNIDWGQDLLYLKRWLDRHPEAQPLGVAYDVPYVDPRILGITYTWPPVGRDCWDPAPGQSRLPQTSDEMGPKPGWCAVSINQIHGYKKRYDYLLRSEPVAMAGYSIYIYHITPEEANRVRRELGMPELTIVGKEGGE